MFAAMSPAGESGLGAPGADGTLGLLARGSGTPEP